MSTEPEPETEADRRATNIALAIGFIVLVGGGIWLANAMVDAARPMSAWHPAGGTACRSKRRRGSVAGRAEFFWTVAGNLFAKCALGLDRSLVPVKQ